MLATAAAWMGEVLDDRMESWLMPAQRGTINILSFGAMKVPMILYAAPRVERLDAAGCHVRIPLNWRTKNHFGSMYFGALAVGADVAGGVLAMQRAEAQKAKVKLLFKDFKADFVRRSMRDTVFICDEGPGIDALIAEAQASSGWVHYPLKLTAHEGHAAGTTVATFVLTLSLKNKSSSRESKDTSSSKAAAAK